MKVDVAVLGATGLVGTRIVERLVGHPSLRLREVVASERSAGRVLASALGPAAERLPPEVAALRLLPPGAPLQAPLLLSALPAVAAAHLEPEYASRGHRVCSNASALRRDPRVPLLIPEINPDSLRLLVRQPWHDAGGGIVTNPNCMVCGLALALAPLQRAFGLAAATVVTMQAISGAGRDGLGAWRTHGNVVPDIPGEADKIPFEIGKILGVQVPLAVAVNRVPVLEGHMASVFVRLRRHAGLDELAAALGHGVPADRELPSSPPVPLRLLQAPDRPQPRLDCESGEGMTVSIGALATAPGHDARFSVLVHNLIRGAAGACVLNAELLVARDLIAAGPAMTVR